MNRCRSTPQILNALTIRLTILRNSMIQHLSPIDGKSFSAWEISFCCNTENLDGQNSEGQLRSEIHWRNLSRNLALPESALFINHENYSPKRSKWSIYSLNGSESSSDVSGGDTVIGNRRNVGVASRITGMMIFSRPHYENLLQW
jgi:hypothetical protein